MSLITYILWQCHQPEPYVKDAPPIHAEEKGDVLRNRHRDPDRYRLETALRSLDPEAQCSQKEAAQMVGCIMLGTSRVCASDQFRSAVSYTTQTSQLNLPSCITNLSTRLSSGPWKSLISFVLTTSRDSFLLIRWRSRSSYVSPRAVCHNGQVKKTKTEPSHPTLHGPTWYWRKRP